MRGLFALLFLPTFLLSQSRVAELPNVLNESSGLAKASPTSLYTINDSGNDAILYEVDLNGTLINEIDLEEFGIKNKDIESLAQDLLYLYVADFGNNMNRRKDLTIYKISKAQLRRGWGNAQQIHFIPNEQQQFPPKDARLQFDFEGMYATHTELVVFSKNRTEPMDGIARMYRLSKNPGTQRVTASDSVFLQGNGQFEQWVAGADYHPGRNIIALMSGPQIHMIVKDAQDRWIDLPTWCGITQKEAVLFGSNFTIYATDEVNKMSTGKLYEFDYELWFKALEDYRRAPVNIVQTSLTQNEKLVVKIDYMRNLQCPVTVSDSRGNVLTKEVFQSKYYPRNLGEKENIIQKKALLLPASEWPIGEITVKVEHPMGTLIKSVTIRP